MNIIKKFNEMNEGLFKSKIKEGTEKGNQKLHITSERPKVMPAPQKRTIQDTLPLPSPSGRKSYTEEDMLNSYSAGQESITYNDDEGFGSDLSFYDWIKTYYNK